MAYEVRVVAENVEAFVKAKDIFEITRDVNTVTRNNIRVTIPKGTAYLPAKMYVVGEAGSWVFYLSGKQLLSMGLEPFAHQMSHHNLTADLYDRTKAIIPAANLMAAFCIGLGMGMCTFWVGTAITAGTKMFQLYIFYEKNERAIKKVAAHSAELFSALTWMKEHAPVTHEQILKLLGEHLDDALYAAAGGITPSTCAPIVGRLIGQLVSMGKNGPGKYVKTGLVFWITTLTKMLATATATNFPIFLQAGLIRAGKATAAVIGEAFATAGQPVSEGVARMMEQEWKRPEAPEQIVQFFAAAKALSEEMGGLAQALDAEIPDF
ncbi:hypothetical protein [Vannielia litorea]|uniref:Uncharacterized protein n=1 Tax=Vannielia litorea TaxID=1217970 RepID=A0A1N6FL69_9RHOB|nr:hypothetical protein [Vannielia litorea]SIN96033.1 hypothetical protein SAMN05444002_1761 [Vannielia litorea]